MLCETDVRVDHVAILVRDIDQSLPYYVDRLCLRLISDERLPEAGVRLAYLDAGNTMFQLVEPTQPGPLRDHLALHGEGLHHVCIAVRDIDDAIARMAPGAEIRVSMGGRGRRAAFLPAGPDGLRTELTEIEPYVAKEGA